MTCFCGICSVNLFAPLTLVLVMSLVLADDVLLDMTLGEAECACVARLASWASVIHQTDVQWLVWDTWWADLNLTHSPESGLCSTLANQVIANLTAYNWETNGCCFSPLSLGTIFYAALLQPWYTDSDASSFKLPHTRFRIWQEREYQFPHWSRLVL